MTILKLVPADIKDLVDLWYDAPIIAHNSIPDRFWQENKTTMAEIYLPNSETFNKN